MNVHPLSHLHNLLLNLTLALTVIHCGGPDPTAIAPRDAGTNVVSCGHSELSSIPEIRPLIRDSAPARTIELEFSAGRQSIVAADLDVFVRSEGGQWSRYAEHYHVDYRESFSLQADYLLCVSQHYEQGAAFRVQIKAPNQLGIQLGVTGWVDTFTQSHLAIGSLAGRGDSLRCAVTPTVSCDHEPCTETPFTIEPWNEPTIHACVLPVHAGPLSL